MQRILKYHLLLRELLQSTQQTHEEYHTIHQVGAAAVCSMDILLFYYQLCDLFRGTVVDPE
jgi:hypothetical protein